MSKIMKSYRFDQKSIIRLQKIMNEKNLKSETAAIEFLIYNYTDIENNFQFDDLNKKTDKLLLRTKIMDFNLQILLEALNTILTEENYSVPVFIDNNENLVIDLIKQHIKGEIAYKKQIKDDNESRGR